MATGQKSSKKKKRSPAKSPEAREKQLISLAVDLAEQQLIDGTASPSVITHYLKLGSTKEMLEKEMLARKTELVAAQTESLKTAKHIEELYSNAIRAMQIYSGHEDYDEEL